MDFFHSNTINVDIFVLSNFQINWVTNIFVLNFRMYHGTHVPDILVNKVFCELIKKGHGEKETWEKRKALPKKALQLFRVLFGHEYGVQLNLGIYNKLLFHMV